MWTAACPDTSYVYDGSFAGLLCCFSESCTLQETPVDIRQTDAEPVLFDTAKWILTDKEKAEKVYLSIRVKISRQAQELVRLGFLTCTPRKEMLLCEFLRLGFRYGAKATTMLTDDSVADLTKAVRHLTNESHKLMGFVRFSVYDNFLVSVIEPKNFVLPLLAGHFCNRFSDETFMIYDQTHKAALVWQNRKADILSVEALTLPDADSDELAYRGLWQQFYKTIAVQTRENPRCRMTLMPKRYWGHLTEQIVMLS